MKFNKILYSRCKQSMTAGFTLLEVMVAVAVIAISFVTLLGAQSQSVVIATTARFNVKASFLAQLKLTEINMIDYNELTSEEGDFGEEFAGFLWSVDVAELTEDDVGIKGANEMLKQVDLTVHQAEDKAMTYSVHSVVFKNVVADE